MGSSTMSELETLELFRPLTTAKVDGRQHISLLAWPANTTSHITIGGDSTTK